MIPIGELRVEAQMIKPPKPVGFHVLVEGRTVVILSFETVKAAYDQYTEMQKFYDKPR